MNQPGVKIEAAGLPEAIRLGVRAYREVWELQKKLLAELIENRGGESVIVCQHHPVITVGKSSREENLLVSEGALQACGIELFRVERGGDMTYHGPGQLVMYPILDLRRRTQDVAWYMRNLEEVVIRTLFRYGVTGRRIQGKTGVWIDSTSKIASLGVRISRWCTMHGLALNVRNCEKGFSFINPCGFRSIRMVSMEQQTGAAMDMEEAESALLQAFFEVFG